MNLQEFKAAIESDATRRADEQEVTIKGLHGQIKALSCVNEELRVENIALKERCENLDSKQHAMSLLMIPSIIGSMVKGGQA